MKTNTLPRTCFMLLYFLGMGCTKDSCNAQYDKLDDIFPNEVISDFGYTKCIVKLQEHSLDSIIAEYIFAPIHGCTKKSIYYYTAKSDSGRTVFSFEYAPEDQLILTKVVECMTQLFIEQKINRWGKEKPEKRTYKLDTLKINTLSLKETVLQHYRGDTLNKFEVYSKDSCGYEIGYKEYSHDSTLLSYSEFELNEYGIPVKSSKYKADSTLIAVQYSEYKGRSAIPLSEKRYMNDTLVYSKTTSFDSDGLESKIVTEDLKLKTVTEEAFFRSKNGLITLETWSKIKDQKVIELDSFFYEYQ